MALRKGFTHVEKIEHIVFENAGDLTISVNNVRWMREDDSVLQPPTSYVSMPFVISRCNRLLVAHLLICQML